MSSVNSIEALVAVTCSFPGRLGIPHVCFGRGFRFMGEFGVPPKVSFCCFVHSLLSLNIQKRTDMLGRLPCSLPPKEFPTNSRLFPGV